MLSSAFLIIIGICLLIASVQMWGFHRFRSLRSLVVISKRYPVLVQIECIACILYLLIAVPLWSYTAFNDPHLPDASQLALTLSARILNMTWCHFIVDIEAYRLWLICYQLHYLHSSKNQKWKILIDPSFAERDWYLVNKHKWGNKRYVFARAFVYYTMAVASTVAIYAYTRVFNEQYLGIANLVDAVLFIVPMILINYTYFNSPKELDDNLFFHFEYKATAFIVNAGFVLYVAAITAGILVSAQMEYILVVIGMMTTIAAPSLLSTVVIPFKIESSSQWNSRHDNRATMVMAQILDALHRDKNSCDSSTSDQPSKGKRDTLTSKLRETLQDEVKFEAFMDWMYREFSSEVMLSVIELGQFKQYLKEYVQRASNPFDLPADRVKTIRFYNDMPRSSIIFQPPVHTLNLHVIERLRSTSAGEQRVADSSPDAQDSPAAETDEVVISRTPDEERTEKQRMKNIASALYEKYIRRHCELEVNISYGLRNRWDRLHCDRYPEEDLIELIQVVDEVLSEMLRFISQSYRRFECSRK